VVNDVASAGEGAEIYVIERPAEVVGKSFDEALPGLRARYNYILIGLRSEEKAVQVCPAGSQIIGPGHELVILALEPPGA